MRVPGRRDALRVLAAGGFAAVFGCKASDRAPPSLPAAGNARAPDIRDLSCIVKPAQTEGPYFVDEKLERADIRTDPTDGSVKAGIPLELTISVYQIAGGSCAPLAGALVDIWQCDATGTYSDVADTDARFNTSGKKFLRGYLRTNAEGLACFTTIYPGWYPGRTPHLHFKVRAGAERDRTHEFTSQLYFDDALTARAYTQAPYSVRGKRDTTNSADEIYREGGEQLLLSLTPQGAGYRTTFGLGLRFS